MASVTFFVSRMPLILDFNSLEVAMLSSPFRQLKAISGKERSCFGNNAVFDFVGQSEVLVDFVAKNAASVLKMVKKVALECFYLLYGNADKKSVLSADKRDNLFAHAHGGAIRLAEQLHQAFAVF